MNKKKPHIIKTEHGTRLVVGSTEYEFTFDSFVDLKGKEIPQIAIDQLPEEVHFYLYHEDKYMLVVCPPSIASGGNVEICVAFEIEYELQIEVDCRLGDFLEAEGVLVEEGSDDETGHHFASVNLPGNTIDALFENAERLIEGFWSKHRSLLKRVDKDMH